MTYSIKFNKDMFKMSLFKCSKCGTVDNTAIGDFWDCEKPLCTECARGKWHGIFPKVNATDAGYYIDSDGFVYSPEEIDVGKMEWTYNRNIKMIRKA